MNNGGGESPAVCSTATGNGREDVYSCKESDASSVDHLVVMMHGILGRQVRFFMCVVFELFLWNCIFFMGFCFIFSDFEISEVI